MKTIKHIFFLLAILLLSKNTVSASQSQPFQFVDAPETIVATKSITLKTNAPEGADVLYTVSNEKYAEIKAKDILTGKKVGTVTVTATWGEQSTQTKISILGKKTIYIDPGHQKRGNSTTEPIGPGSSVRKAKVAGGATGVSTKIPEYKFTLNIAKKLKSALLAEGYAVVMSRTSNNVDISNATRAKKGNTSGADICIRIHGDSINNSSVTGASVLYPSTSNKFPIRKQAKKSKKLAKCLLNAYCKKTKIKSRGIVVRNDLSGTNWSTIPTALIECGFLSNATEDKQLNDPAFQKKMAEGMVDGINRYFGYK